MRSTAVQKYLTLQLVVIILSCMEVKAGDTIYIVQEFWHTGIVFRIRSVPPETFPEIRNYSRSEYIDISWGDERYYQIPGHSVLLAARAVLFPTPAVIKLMDFSRPVEKFYGKATVMQIIMDSTRFSALCRFISESFVRDEQQDIIPSTVYGKSDRFFMAKRKYHLFRTCNTWVALALKRSGFDVSTFLVLNAAQMFNRIEKIPRSEYLQKNGN